MRSAFCSKVIGILKRPLADAHIRRVPDAAHAGPRRVRAATHVAEKGTRAHGAQVLLQRERRDGGGVRLRAFEHGGAILAGKIARDPVREREDLVCACVNFPEVAARPAARLAVHAHAVLGEELRLQFVQPRVRPQGDGMDIVRSLRVFEILRRRIAK